MQPMRRARPALGTLVEVGVIGYGMPVRKGMRTGEPAAPGATEAAIEVASVAPEDAATDAAIDAPTEAACEAAIAAAFAAIAEVEACLSIFQPGSDLSRFHGLAAGASIIVQPHTAQVLAAAAALQEASAGLFDISLGSGPQGWQLSVEGGPPGASSTRSPPTPSHRLTRLSAQTHLDPGGIAKGHAVDAAIQALQAAGCPAGWVNAGGDLRCYGELALPLMLRDEHSGGTRAFAELRDGAFATSHYGQGSRSQLHKPRHMSWQIFRHKPWHEPPAAAASLAPSQHVSVAAPLCLWADALTKIVALSDNPAHPLLARFQAQAWLHPGADRE